MGNFLKKIPYLGRKFHLKKSPKKRILKTLTLTQEILKYSDYNFPNNNTIDKHLCQKMILDKIIS